MNQSEKSWNGRLTAREAELKARAAELAEKESALANGPKPLPGYDEAVAALTADFGEDFISYIQAIAAGSARQESEAAVKTSVADIIDKIDGFKSAVSGAFSAMHKDAIVNAHEDFEEIVNTYEFANFIGSLPDGDREKAQQVAANGSASQVVRLLKKFKVSLQQAEQGKNGLDTAALDAAAGVRSAGGRSPSMGGLVPGNETDRYRAGFNA